MQTMTEGATEVRIATMFTPLSRSVFVCILNSPFCIS